MKLYYCSRAQSEISEIESPQIILPPSYPKMRMVSEHQTSEKSILPKISQHNLRTVARLEELLLYSRSYF